MITNTIIKNANFDRKRTHYKPVFSVSFKLYGDRQGLTQVFNTKEEARDLVKKLYPQATNLRFKPLLMFIGEN